MEQRRNEQSRNMKRVVRKVIWNSCRRMSAYADASMKVPVRTWTEEVREDKKWL